MNLEYFKLAQHLNEEYKHILLKENVHYRASLNSLSMISVSGDKPELGVKCNAIKYKSSSDSIVLQDINKIKAKPLPQRNTPEKRLQSWIINYALNHNNQLPFDDDIKFITSELAILNNAGDKIVTDILGYCISKNQLCVIELKSDRLLKRLIEQVNTFEKVINENFYFFNELLSLHVHTNPKGLSQQVKKIIVWPHEHTSPVKKLTESHILEFTYVGNYIFNNHS